MLSLLYFFLRLSVVHFCNVLQHPFFVKSVKKELLPFVDKNIKENINKKEIEKLGRKYGIPYHEMMYHLKNLRKNDKNIQKATSIKFNSSLLKSSQPIKPKEMNYLEFIKEELKESSFQKWEPPINALEGLSYIRGTVEEENEDIDIDGDLAMNDNK